MSFLFRGIRFYAGYWGMGGSACQRIPALHKLYKGIEIGMVCAYMGYRGMKSGGSGCQVLSTLRMIYRGIGRNF